MHLQTHPYLPSAGAGDNQLRPYQKTSGSVRHLGMLGMWIWGQENLGAGSKSLCI
jgi:hypothetical protein